jgi:nucleotide-binding universal stress UspA family protein
MPGVVAVGWDQRPEAEDAVALGELIARGGGASLVLVHVLTRLASAGASLDVVPGALLRSARRRKAALREAASTVGAWPQHVHAPSTSRGLAHAAGELEADLLVVGSSHRAGVHRALAGDVALQLLDEAPCPVAVAPRGYSRRYAIRLLSIGVGFDGSVESGRAVEVASHLAHEQAAELKVVVALEAANGGTDGQPDRVASALQEVASSLGTSTKLECTFLAGAPAEALAREARNGLDLLVLGSRGYAPMRRALLGSVSAELVRKAPCPVLVVPGGDRRAELDAQVAVPVIAEAAP